MDEPDTAADPIPEPARERRWPTMMISLLTALMLNVLLLATLFFVTVSENRRTPPAIYATAIISDPDPPIESPTLDQPKPSIRAGGSPLSPIMTIAATATSEFSITLPDLPSADDGVAGLAGIGNGFGSGFGTGGSGAGGTMGSMKVGKITVKAMTLGVILDISGSMEEELPEVKREVRKAFRKAKTVDVEGCSLDWTAPADAENRKVRLQSSAESVVEAVEMLVVDGRVDALYWFSDLQDRQTEAGLARLRELLRVEKGRAKAVRFYIRSLEREPSPELTAIVKATGGAIQAGEKGE